ncbi:MAG: LapA family protein [Hyphomicrobiales bacterium]|nr:LapA family protein [Hyphomicrobiales bacterium]
MNDGNGNSFRRTKLILAAILGGFLTLFALQNMAEVDLTILFWTFQARRAVVIGLSFVIGLAIGWIIGAHGRSHED